MCLPASSIFIYTLAPRVLDKEVAVVPEQIVKTESSRNLKDVEIIEFDEEQGNKDVEAEKPERPDDIKNIKMKKASR